MIPNTKVKRLIKYQNVQLIITLAEGTYNVESYKSDMTIRYGTAADIPLSDGESKNITIIYSP
jgi:hypothetical protein